MRVRRLLSFGIAGFLLAAAIGAWVYFWQARPIGSGSAGPPLAREALSHLSSDRSYLLIGIGDSMTAGFGARRGYSYFDRLVANPADEFPDLQGISLGAILPRLQFTNLAVSGSTSGQHLSQQLPRLPAVGSNVSVIVVLTTGGNDLIHNYGRTPPREEAMFGSSWEPAQPWITNFQQRLTTMLKQIGDKYPGHCQVFLANIYDPTDGQGDVERAGLPAWKDGMRIHAAYNEVIQASVSQFAFVHLVDVHRAFLGHGIHCTQFWASHYDSRDPHYWYFTNLEDPNERGYDVLRRLYLQEIGRSFARAGKP